MNRRAVITTVAGGIAATFGGCLSLEPPPEPRVVSTAVPDVRAASGERPFVRPLLDQIEGSNEARSIEVALVNEGASGSVSVQLSLLERIGSSNALSAAVPQHMASEFFDAGERRTVTFDDVDTRGYEAYAIRVNAGSVTAMIHNGGGEGTVMVMAMAPGGATTYDAFEITMGADETREVTFEGWYAELGFEIRTTAA